MCIGMLVVTLGTQGPVGYRGIKGLLRGAGGLFRSVRWCCGM